MHVCLIKSNENEFYAKIIEIDAVYNFVVNKFFTRNCLEQKNVVLKITVFKHYQMLIWSI